MSYDSILGSTILLICAVIWSFLGRFISGLFATGGVDQGVMMLYFLFFISWPIVGLMIGKLLCYFRFFPFNDNKVLIGWSLDLFIIYSILFLSVMAK